MSDRQTFEGYAPGDEVIFVKNWSYRGKTTAYFGGLHPKAGDVGIVQKASIQLSESRKAGVLGIEWNGRGLWTDVATFEPRVSEKELQEVYEILGVKPAEPQPHCSTCTCLETSDG